MPSGLPCRRIAILSLVLAATGCPALEEAAEAILDRRTARERYTDGLLAAGLAGTALVTGWLTAGERAVALAPTVPLPHAETGYLPPNEPIALGFRVEGRRGQEVRFDFTLPGDSTTLAFLDAWAEDSSGVRLLEAADSGVRSLVIEPRRDGTLVFRVQLELLRGGRFETRIGANPILAFPVQNGRDQDIGSDFGAPRDAGARSHHGIDIFAKRGTPALAGADARVTRVDTSRLGGKVVWLRDERGHSLYYAHLDSQMVREGSRVRRGDTVGLVGNTGNAARTPPHLHFGIYRRGEGPVDPGWFVRRPGGAVPRLLADTSLVGRQVRTRLAEVAVLPASERLPRHTPVRVVAAFGDWFRIVLPDGAGGLIRAAGVEPIVGIVATTTIPDSRAGLRAPGPANSTESIVSVFRPGDTLGVLGRFGGYALVGLPDGGRVWVVD